jgi:uncharacterized protein (DUF58 family)
MVFRAGDRVGAVVFDDVQVRRSRSHRSRARVQEMLGAIAAMNGALAADRAVRPDPAQLDRAIEDALRRGPCHLVCIVSDFAGAGERTLELLRALRAHNDVIGCWCSIRSRTRRSPRPGAWW